MSEMVYDPTTTTVLKLIDLLHDLVILFVKLVIDFVVSMDLKTSDRNVATGSVLTPEFVDFRSLCLVTDTTCQLPR